jgi:hypothetical protein
MLSLELVDEIQEEDDLHCPIFTAEGDQVFQSFSLWVEGILCCFIAVPGFFGNISSSFVLLQKGKRSTINDVTEN